jgi:hypothetical protein
MAKLKVTITDENKAVTGEYEIDCLSRPGLDAVAYDTAYTLDIIRAAAERHRYLVDFPEPPVLSFTSATYDLTDPVRTVNLHNVNELWFEVQNLLYGARLNLASARMFKELEDGHSSTSQTDLNAKFDLHLDKLERFHLGIYEIAHIEDLIVRIVYEFFGDGFIEVDVSRTGWEKRLTWDTMKGSLNKRAKPEKQPHSRLESMSDEDYTKLMDLVRSYRSPRLLQLIGYRDRRTHRVAPTVDHAALGVVLQSLPPSRPVPVFMSSPDEAEFDFLELYATAKEVYAHLLRIIAGISEIVHA